MCAALTATCLLLAAPPGRAFAQPAATPAAPAANRPALSDEAVARALAKGETFLLRARKADGTYNTAYAARHPGGVEALVLLAVRTAGKNPAVAPWNLTLAQALQAQPSTVYARSMRTMLLAALARKADRPTLEADAAWLLRYQSARWGGWGYGPGHPTTLQTPLWTDSINTEMAILALANAARRGVKVSPAAWARARLFWSRSRNSDGGWGYCPPDVPGFRVQGSSYGTTTAAAVASLLLLRDGPSRLRSGSLAARADQHVESGLDWLNKHFAVHRIPAFIWGKNQSYYYVYLHTLARASQAAGRARYGRVEWAPAVAAELLAQQRPNGSWPGQGARGSGLDVPCTALAMLALDAARTPVLLHWLADEKATPTLQPNSLTRRVVDLLGMPCTWRHYEPTDAKDNAPAPAAEAPLLVVDWRTAPTMPLTQAGLRDRAVRLQVEAGGTVVVLAGSSAAPVAARIAKLLPAPTRPAGIAGPDDPLWTLIAKVPAENGKAIALHTLGSGVRTSVFVVGDTSEESLGPLLANLAAYALDRGPLPGAFAVIPPAASDPTVTDRLIVSRVKHGGDWDAVPDALKVLDGLLAHSVSLGVRRGLPVDLTAPVPHRVDLLWMTGTTGPTLTDKQRAALRTYVDKGGTLFVDAAVGTAAFGRTARTMLEKIFGTGKLLPLGPRHPLMTGRVAGGAGCDLRQVSTSRALRKALPRLHAAELYGIEVHGRLAVVFSPYGVTCPLKGLRAFDQMSYAPQDARRIAANVLLLTASHRPNR